MASTRVAAVLMARASLPTQASTRIPHLLAAMASKRAVLHTPLQPVRHASTHLPRMRKRPPPPQPAGSEPEAPRRSTAFFFWPLGVFASVVGTYLFYYWASYRAARRHAQQHVHLAPNEDVSNRWNSLDRDFDEEVEFAERAMFMGRKRRRLLQRAEGRVLEVSCGTGRNFGWYDFERDARDARRITEVVFNDQSEVQMRVARGKWEDLQGRRREEPRKNGKPFEGSVKGVVGDAGVRGVIRRPEGGFDTIVQTMGVCSMSDPVGFLRQMNYLVRQPGEGIVSAGREGDEGGRILLLEHGRGSYERINQLLDESAVMHADRYGCWFNKDIGEVVRQSGLKVDSIRRYHLGTTWEVVLRPNPELLKELKKPVMAILAAPATTGPNDGREMSTNRSNSWWPWQGR